MPRRADCDVREHRFGFDGRCRYCSRDVLEVMYELVRYHETCNRPLAWVAVSSSVLGTLRRRREARGLAFADSNDGWHHFVGNPLFCSAMLDPGAIAAETKAEILALVKENLQRREPPEA